MMRRPPRPPLFPYPTLSRSLCTVFHSLFKMKIEEYGPFLLSGLTLWNFLQASITQGCDCFFTAETDRKSTRLNSSHQIISYAVFCLKKKKLDSRKTSLSSVV